MVSPRTIITIIVVIYSAFNYYCDYVQFHIFSGFQSNSANVVETYDFIVVGAGSAGSAVANRLSKHNTVLLLEAGGYPPPLINVPILAPYFSNQQWIDWQHKTVPQEHCCQQFHGKSVLWPRGKMLGGTSNLNYMIYMRGHPKDFDNWANITQDEQWNYENVMPYFKKMENYHGTYKTEKTHSKGGPLHIEDLQFSIALEANKYLMNATREMGFKVADPNYYQEPGFFPFDYTTKDGSRFGTFKAYLKPILSRSNLQISLYSQATKIHFDKNQQAYAVTYMKHGVKQFARARKEIIVSGGALESPKLLMLSGIGPKLHLKKLNIKLIQDLPVGKNLQDHVFGFVGPFVVNKSISFLDKRDTSLGAIWEYRSNGTGVFSFPVVSAGGVFSSSLEHSNWPDIFTLFSPTAQSIDLIEGFEGLMGVPMEYLKDIVGTRLGEDSYAFGVSIGRPKSKGEVLLNDKDPSSPLLIDPKYLSHPDDVRIMLDGIKYIIDMMEETQTFKDVGTYLPADKPPPCAHLKFNTDEYWKCTFKQFLSTMFHPCGTCRMGNANDPLSVLDSHLRVLGVKNVRVVDASIFPDITNANINAPTIMVAEKASDLIIEYWSNQYQICNQIDYIFYNEQFKCFYSQLS